MKEAQGMKADGTRLFRESNTRVGTGVPPESSECSNVDTIMAEVEVSETSIIFSHEPVNVMDNASSEEHPQREDKQQERTACIVLPATTEACVLSGSEDGGEASSSQHKDANAAHNNNLLSQQNKKNLHDNVSVPVSESSVAIDDQLSYMSSEASTPHFKSCLEFGNVLWEDNINIFDVTCEVQGECPLGKEDSLKSNTSYETLELLEEWAPNIKMNKTASPVRSSEEPSSDDEQEVGICLDHSYSSLFKEGSEHQTSEEHLEGDIRPVLSEIDSTQKQMDQLRAFPNAGCMATEVEKNRPFLVEASNVCRQETLGGLQNSSIVSVNSVLTCHDSLDDDTILCQESLPNIEPNSDDSATHLHASNATCTVGTNLVIDEENHEIIQHSDEHSFTQQANVTLSSSEFLDSLLGGGFTGLSAKLKSEHAHCLLHHRRKSSSANQKCDSSVLTSVPSMSSDTEKRVTDRAIKTNTEEGDRPEMSHASVHIGTVGPSKECDVKRCDSPNQCCWGHLDRKDGSLDSACCVGVSFKVEAESQRTDDGKDDYGGVNAEEILDVDKSIYPLDTYLKQELIKASLEVNDRMEMLGNVKVYENCLRNNMNEKSTDGKGLEKTVHPLKFESFKKGPIPEELEKYQAHPSSSSSSSNLKTDLNSDRPASTKLQDHPVLFKHPSQHQTKVQTLVCQDYHLNSLDQKNVNPQEVRVLACQKHVLDISKKQVEHNTVQPVNHSLEETQKSFVCTQDESLCPKRDQDINPQNHLVLLIKNGDQETFQPSMRGNSSSYKKISKLISNPLKGRLIELSNTGMLLERFGRTSELLKSNRFIQKRGCQRAAQFCSVLRSVRRRSLEMRTKKSFLKFSSKPTLLSNHSFFLLKSLTLRTAGGQRSTEGVCSKLFKDSLIRISLGLWPTQNLEACLPEKDEPSTSLSVNVLDFSPAAAVLLEIKADDHIHLVFSEDGKASCSVKEDGHVGSPPGSTVHIKPGVGVVGKVLSIASSGPDPSKKQSSVNYRSLIIEKMKIPVHSLSKDSSGALLDLLVVRKEEITIPFESKIYVRPPFFHPPDYISELSLNEGHTHAKDPSKLAVVKQFALQPKDVFPSVTPGTFCNTVPFASLSISMFEALAKCFSSKERNLQSTEKQTRDQRKTLDYLANIGNEGPVNKRTFEMGDSTIFMKKTMQEGVEESLAEYTAFSDAASQQLQAKDKGEAENLFRQRSVRTGCLLASSSNEVVAFSAGKSEDPTWTLVMGSIIEDGENKHHCSTLRNSKRPKKSKDLIGLEYMEAKDSEARSPSLCFRNHSQQSTSIAIPVPVFCRLPQAFGIRRTFKSAHEIRRSLVLRRRSGNICKNDYMQGHFKVRRKSNQIKSSAFLKNLLKIVPKYKYKLISSIYLAMKPAVIEDKTAMIQGQPPKQRANRSSLVGSSGFSEPTKDPTVLKRLSALASNLLDPLTNLQNFNIPMSFTNLFPLAEKNSQLGRKKLLEVFSWVNMKLNSQWIKGSYYSTKMFSSQSLALYPTESTNVCVLEPRNNTPLAFSTPTFPLSFHIQMSSSPMTSIQEFTSFHSFTNRVALGELEALQPAKWTFSFLLSQSNLGESPVHEDACVPTESRIASASFHAAKDSRRYTIAKRSSGCSMLGLQTVLALSSFGCYRLWTRKRNLTSQIPAIQRLTVLQFTQGLKGLECSTSVSADLFSSLPYLLGRVLSIWSQHGPSTCPSEFTPLHSNRCKWQPVTTATTSLGLGNSSATLPHVPDQVVEAPRIVYNELRLEPYFSASLPTSCLIPERERSPLGLLPPEFQVYPLDDVSVPVLPATGAQLEKEKIEKRPKKVSQIRIRKTIPKPDPNLTPMGLPRPKRLKKTEFSLEEIYTNKNYRSPPATRCLETIFEEPKEKNGSLISVSQQKRKRILEFQDFTIPRKRKARGRIKVMGSFTRAQKAALEGRELDALLIQKLTDLETFFAMEEEREQGHASGS
ncbi:protein PRR14L isoform X2 [Eublepharis macularius]|nr:protein PRR14L isoform X2 [Eublepharis macularius]XP_054851716.1 protein PRR14L isoform X2 [Eublepharis macularius]